MMFLLCIVERGSIMKAVFFGNSSEWKKRRVDLWPVVLNVMNSYHLQKYKTAAGMEGK